ncbi:MAG: hypothetical protein DWQ05_20400 [Calditrichaeota bacterium]|nr:MAG: hypothetical protein DWQ05_20400 [Calditrichota bacterium]
MNGPGSQSSIVLFSWFALMLVLIYLHRRNAFLSRKTFLTTLFVGTFLLFFILFYLEKDSENDFSAGRVAIFPFRYQTADSSVFTPFSLAIPDLTGQIFNAANSRKYFAIPLEWLIIPSQTDSSGYVANSRRQASRLKAANYLTGNFRKSGSRLRYEILHFSRSDEHPKNKLKFSVAKDSLKFAGRAIARFIRQQLDLPEIQDDRVPDFSPEYYEAQLNLMRGDTVSAKQNLGSLAPNSAEYLKIWGRISLTPEKRQQLSPESRKIRTEKLTQAVLNFTKKDSSDIDITILTATCMLWQGNYNQAENFLKKAHRLESRRAEIYQLFSRLHFSRYKELGFENEIELLEHALQLNPANLDLVRELASTYLMQKKTEKATELLEEYIRHYPNNFMLLNALGQTYIKRGHSLKIFEIYNKILKIDPENSEAFYNLGIYYFHSGDFAAAKGFFAKALINKEQINSFLYLAHMAEKENFPDEAIYYLQQRIKFRHSPDDEFAEEARRRLFNLNIAAGKIDSSGQIIQRDD